MTKVLSDIKGKKHEKKACFSNCKENGKAFNQKPHQCTYHTGSQRYRDLLEYHTVPDVVAEDEFDRGISSNPNITKFCLQLILLEDYKEEINIGVRKEEDIMEVENTVETL